MTAPIDPLSATIGRLEAVAERLEGALAQHEERIRSLEGSRKWALGAGAVLVSLLGVVGAVFGLPAKSIELPPVAIEAHNSEPPL